MTIRLVLFLVLACLAIDYLVRRSLLRRQAERERLELAKYLSSPVRLAFAEEAASLQRAELPNPKARILAVDDEKVILDSFRRILVLEGYSLDTVQSGPEALSLLRRNDYDFVFTDLKMPDMTGVEVVKAVKHLRPDLDVVVITGYGTIETAVETMTYGACEYLQKPFTADELAAYVHKLLVKRQARLKAARRGAPRVIRLSEDEAPDHDGAGQDGLFFGHGHTWVWIEPGGDLRVGVDAFASQAMDGLGDVVLPAAGLEVRRGDPLFSLKRGGEERRFPAPVSGRVREPNGSLAAEPFRVTRSPYRDGWICRMDPSDLAGEIGLLKIGGPGPD